jgi:prealbumin domain-containing protein
VTVNLSSPRAKPRWLILCLVVLGLSAVGVGLTAGHGATTLPAGYVGSTLEDVHGANDVPGQVDVTIMGRDNTQLPKLRIFWSWDSITAWTGTGQSGDACALFDTTDADAFINYVVCARVENPTAAPTTVTILPSAANKPVYIFDCSNKKDDRCTNPTARSYTAGQVLAGPIGSPNVAGTGDLISELDPFDASDLNGPGESWKHDSTIDIEIAAALVPAQVSLANVCSYPSAGNGGNNNPFDCIVTPGTQYGTLRVVKSLITNSGGTKGVADFSFDVSGGVANDVAFDASDNTNEFIVPVGTYTVGENAASGYTTTYANSTNTNANCNSIVVSVGAVTTCTVTNNDTPGSLTLVKRVRNDNNGTATVTNFGLSTNAGSLTFDTGAADGANVTKYTSNAISVAAGSYTFSENDVTGYSEGTWSCTGATASGTSFSAGSVTVPLETAVVCTITNDDDQGSLTLVKRVVNNSGGSATVTDFTLGTNAGSLTFGSGVADGTATLKYTSNTIDVNAGAYTLSEANVAGYTEGSWSCPLGTSVTSTFSAGSVTVPNGVAVVCTITNDDDKASPTGATTQSYILYDSLTITGLRSGAPDASSATVVFKLFSSDTCSAGSQVGSTVTVTGVTTSTVAIPAGSGIAVSTAGTYYWLVTYSGDQYNNPITKSCGQEQTTISKTE